MHVRASAEDVLTQLGTKEFSFAIQHVHCAIALLDQIARACGFLLAADGEIYSMCISLQIRHRGIVFAPVHQNMLCPRYASLLNDDALCRYTSCCCRVRQSHCNALLVESAFPVQRKYCS